MPTPGRTSTALLARHVPQTDVVSPCLPWGPLAAAAPPSCASIHLRLCGSSPCTPWVLDCCLQMAEVQQGPQQEDATALLQDLQQQATKIHANLDEVQAALRSAEPGEERVLLQQKELLLCQLLLQLHKRAAQLEQPRAGGWHGQARVELCNTACTVSQVCEGRAAWGRRGPFVEGPMFGHFLALGICPGLAVCPHLLPG